MISKLRGSIYVRGVKRGVSVDEKRKKKRREEEGF